jgi:hypothetical protein
MVTWCSSAVNRTRLSRLAISRMRSSAGETLSQLCVWHVLLQTALPLAPPFHRSPPRPQARPCSATSAVLWASPTSSGRTSSDYGCVLLDADRSGPDFPKRPASGYPGSRAGGFHACERSQTTQGRGGASHGAPSRVAFRLSPRRRHPGPSTFRGSILCPRVPLSTLHRHPRGCQCMTRGRRDWLIFNVQNLHLQPPAGFAGARRMLDPSSSPSASRPHLEYSPLRPSAIGCTRIAGF